MEAHEGFEKIHLHRHPFGARSSISVRIRIGSICAMFATKTKASLVFAPQELWPCHHTKSCYKAKLHRANEKNGLLTVSIGAIFCAAARKHNHARCETNFTSNNSK